MLKCELLNGEHHRQDFDCGNAELNRFLQQFANQYSKRGLAKTHVLVDSEQPQKILGYYSLSSLHIDHSVFPIKGYPTNLAIPAMLIGRLAVEKKEQGKGLSKYLLSHALNLILALSEKTGIACVVVDAKNEQLAQYYQRLGFTATSNPLRLVIALRTLQGKLSS